MKTYSKNCMHTSIWSPSPNTKIWSSSSYYFSLLHSRSKQYMLVQNDVSSNSFIVWRTLYPECGQQLVSIRAKMCFYSRLLFTVNKNHPFPSIQNHQKVEWKTNKKSGEWLVCILSYGMQNEVYPHNCVCAAATIHLVMALFMKRSLRLKRLFRSKK